MLRSVKEILQLIMVFYRGNIYIFRDAVYLFVYLFFFQNLKKTILKIRSTGL